MPMGVSGDIKVVLERAMKKFAKNMGKKRNIYFQPFADEEYMFEPGRSDQMEVALVKCFKSA